MIKKTLTVIFTLFLLIVVVVFIISIIIFILMWKYQLGVSDWTVDINNYYHISSNAGEVDVLYYDNTQEYPKIKRIIPVHVEAYSVMGNRLFVNQRPSDTSGETAELYYIADIVGDTLDGPLSKEAFENELQHYGIYADDIAWISTSPKPADAHY